MKKENIDGWLLETIEKAIEAGKLYELIFTKEGGNLWAGYPEQKIRMMVQKALRRRKGGR